MQQDFNSDPLGVTDEDFAVFEVDDSSKEYIVTFGEKEFESEAGSIRCRDCDWHTSSEKQLYFHRKTLHPEQRSYQCPACDKCFNKKCNLQAHSVVHTGEKPFQCPECDSSFTRKGDLDRHSLLHTGTRPYACTFCCSTFTQKPHLVSHMRCHSGERPYQCKHCPASYTRNTHLVRHQRVHFNV